MTIAEMKHHFYPPGAGHPGRGGETIGPLAQWEENSASLRDPRQETPCGHQPRGGLLPRGPAGGGERQGKPPSGRPGREIGDSPEEIEIYLAPLDVIRISANRVVYLSGHHQPPGVDRLAASAAEVKNVFFVPLDYLMHYPEEVYSYTVSAQVDDQFPYERMGFPIAPGFGAAGGTKERPCPYVGTRKPSVGSERSWGYFLWLAP